MQKRVLWGTTCPERGLVNAVTADKPLPVSFTPPKAMRSSIVSSIPTLKAYEEDWLNLEIAEPERLLPLLKQYPEGVEEYGNVQ
jgi:hypothetical protein